VKRLAPGLAALLPAIVGLILAVSLQSLPVFNPTIRLGIDLGTAILLLSIAASVLLLPSFIFWGWWAEYRRQKASVRIQAEAAADRRRFLQRLDHELKNPLTAIRIGMANLADGFGGGTSKDTFYSIHAQVQRISRLTADLRKLAELETRPIERATVNLSALLTQAVELAHDHPDAETRKLTLTLPQAPWPLPSIPGDRDLLLLVVHNFLDNAIKFTRPGGTIEIRAYEDGASVVVEVADTGPGIPEEDVPHVWEELYRGKSARGVPGSGLGLALAAAIVQRHGGRVMLRSRAGQGTVFIIRLPTR
jgi:two-component system, OmpR family, sensor kinase